jgi:hypothetical protein
VGEGFNEKLYMAIKKLRAATISPRPLGAKPTSPHVGSFTSTAACNNSGSYVRHVYDAKFTLSTSFEPYSLLCHNCKSSPHHILKSGEVENSTPACIFLTDQAFPAALPATGG